MMKFHVTKFHAWILTTAPRRPLILFRITFACIWLIYDLIDLCTGQTAQNFLLIGLPLDPDVRVLTGAQMVSIVCELGMLIGWRARWFALAAAWVRGGLSFIFPFNDYLYFTLTALTLSQCDCENSGQDEGLAWPRDILLLQAAWMYFSSALLKLNPDFLSGGDLYARANYVARVVPIYYPGFYLKLISDLRVNSALAWTVVAIEMTLAFLIFAWVLNKPRRKALWPYVGAIVLVTHFYAAYALDVFFFGASMLAQVLILTVPVKPVST